MRERLIEVGLKRFARDGYDATSTTSLLAEAGASKGALYHHFPSKQALFEAIFEHVAESSIARAIGGAASTRMSAGATARSELDRLIDGARRWLKEAERPEVSKILLEEGPRVLGFQRAREIEGRYSLGLMVGGLERARLAGEIDVPDLEFAARIINAALGEAALVRATQANAPSRAKVDATLRKIILGLTM